MPATPEMMGPALPLEHDALCFVFIGASAVGKSVSLRALCEAGIAEPTPTWTTRAPREGERDTNYDHHFVTDEAFDRQIAKGSFVDTKSLYGARYGIPHLAKPAGNKEACIILKPLFIPAFVRQYPQARIYQIDASADVLPDRMRSRGQSEADIAARMDLHASETAEARRFAHVIFENDGLLDETLLLIQAQIREDRKAFDAAHQPALPV